MLFFWATTPFDWIHWYISLVFVNLVMRERNCHSAEVKADELSHISGSNYPVQLIPVEIWTRLVDVEVGLLRGVALLCCLLNQKKKKKNVTNDKKIQTMYQCRGWSLMILWSVLALFSWCVDRVWWVWWGLLGFGWFLTGDGLLIVWCLHALGYCMYIIICWISFNVFAVFIASSIHCHHVIMLESCSFRLGEFKCYKDFTSYFQY